MNNIKTLVFTGYRSFELGVFKAKDPKVAIIKKVIKTRLIEYLDQGLEWLLVGGNLGSELWACEVAAELREDYPDFKLGIIFPFTEFGNNWNEANKMLLADAKAQADFVESTSHKPYETPQQLKNHTRFLLEHSGGCLLLYDNEFPGKAQFFLKDALAYSENAQYQVAQITMDDLQNGMQEDW